MSASAKNQGEVLGIDASVQALGQSIPAIISGYVATFGIAAPVVVGGATIIFAGLVFNIFYKHSNNLAHAEHNTTTLAH